MKRIVKFLLGLIFLLFCLSLLANAGTGSFYNNNHIAQRLDTLVSDEIQAQLSNPGNNLNLHYPNSVKRFYTADNYQQAWIKTGDTKKTWEAMVLIDCVLQYGLSHADYHPNELLYARLHVMLKNPDQSSIKEKARFDIILTDAMITFINHLHYGKLNPEFSSDRIDAGNLNGLNAENTLASALKQPEIVEEILNVQPKSKEYSALQYHMHLLEGVYQEDCYQIPEADVRRMAINMERLRWASINEEYYIHINIPSYSLKVYQKDTAISYKIIVGKPATPTPTLQSAITHFTTAPEWKVTRKIFVNELLPKALKDTNYMANNNFSIYDQKGKYINASKANLAMVSRNPKYYYARQASGCDNVLGAIVFRFSNKFDVFLHDTPEKQLFKREERALSHGCIRVEGADRLADLLMKNDGNESTIPVMQKAVRDYKTRDFVLKSPVPIKITYLTCEVKEGVLTTYKDIYNMDKSLEMALYNTDQSFTMK